MYRTDRIRDYQFNIGRYYALTWSLAAASSICGLVSCGPPTRQGNAAEGMSRGVVLASKSMSPARAMNNIKKVCSFGARFSGSPGMIEQQRYLTEYFIERGAVVEPQEFVSRSPETGERVKMQNLIVHMGPETSQRLLIGCHYDTRPWPERDTVDPRGVFVGANDGASGVATLIEISHAISDAMASDSGSLTFGVDLVLFDAEELVYDERRGDSYFLGSNYFAQEYVINRPSYKYRNGILVDMIGDKFLQLYYEGNSMNYAMSLNKEVWSIAETLGVKEFRPKSKAGFEIRDDHIAINEVAHIPMIDIIDFDYNDGTRQMKNYWHTRDDTPDKCSGESIVKVASVIWTWIQRQK